MTISQVKQYLRVDYDDDDELITTITAAAMDFVKSKVGRWENTPRFEMTALAICAQMYDSRTYAIAATSERSQQYIQAHVSGLLLQLEYNGSDGDTYAC